MKFESNFSKIKRLFVFVLFLCAVNLSAQVTGESTDDSILVLPEIVKQKSCITPATMAQSIVHYKKTSSAYLEFVGTVDAFYVLVTKVVEAKGRSQQTNNQAILLANLDVKFKLQMYASILA